MSERNHELARKYAQMMYTLDISAADEIYAPGFRCHFMGSGMPPLDLDAWKGLTANWFSTFPDFKPTYELSWVGDDGFAVQMGWTATQAGEFMGVPGDGKQVTSQGVSTFRVEDGLVVEEWIFEDLVSLMRTVGVERLPDPAAAS